MSNLKRFSVLLRLGAGWISSDRSVSSAVLLFDCVLFGEFEGTEALFCPVSRLERTERLCSLFAGFVSSIDLFVPEPPAPAELLGGTFG